MTLLHRVFKDPLYDQFARIGKAVANPHRLEMVDLLAQGERRVEDIACEVALGVANASQHLQVLRQAGLIEPRRDGTCIYYRLSDERVFHLWQAIRDLGGVRLAEIDRLSRTYLQDRAETEAIDAGTLFRRLEVGDVIVLDVRPVEEYRSGHIRGARSMPIAELEARLQELPGNSDRDIVAYCRGPYCVFSDDAVALLRAHGFHARRFSLGFPDWRSAGLPVATGPFTIESSTQGVSGA